MGSDERDVPDASPKPAAEPRNKSRKAAPASVGTAEQRIRKLIHDGYGVDEAAEYLTLVGVNRQEAEAAARQVRGPIASANIARGALWIVGGVVATLATYGVSDGLHGGYVIFWGAVVYGVVKLAKGLWEARSE